MDCARRASAPKSFPVISFTDPHPLTAIESYRYKNIVGQAAYHHPPYATHRSPMDSSPFFSYYYGLFCIMQNRISFIFKSFRTLCQKPPGVGGGLPFFSSTFRRSDVSTFKRSASPIAARAPWCHNWKRCEKSSGSGETTPLPPVSKTRRADIGNSSILVPLYPDRVGVASRAWVQRSNAKSVPNVDRSRVARFTRIR